MESCNLIQQITKIKNLNIFNITSKLINIYQKTIDENLKIPQDFVQNSAENALKQLNINYYSMLESESENITIKWCNILKNEIIASINYTTFTINN